MPGLDGAPGRPCWGRCDGRGRWGAGWRAGLSVPWGVGAARCGVTAVLPAALVLGTADIARYVHERPLIYIYIYLSFSKGPLVSRLSCRLRLCAPLRGGRASVRVGWGV